MAKKEIMEVALANVIPDEHQPRQNFDAARLKELMASIKEHGIMNPLVVEDMGNGKYLLVDGERRYRASKELKLKTVPVVTQAPSSAVERTVKQFHLQMQHEDWSPVEKAVAVGYLAQELKLSVRKLAVLLSLPERTIGDYEGFYSLLERKEFQKSEIPLHYARYMTQLVKATKRIYENALEEEFDEDLQRKLERRLIGSIKSGDVTKQVDLTRLKDTFTQNPDMVQKYIKGKDTVMKLYLESDAKVARHARNVGQIATLLSYHINQTEKLGGQELVRQSKTAVTRLKAVHKDAEALLAQVS